MGIISKKTRLCGYGEPLSDFTILRTPSAASNTEATTKRGFLAKSMMKTMFSDYLKVQASL